MIQVDAHLVQLAFARHGLDHIGIPGTTHGLLAVHSGAAHDDLFESHRRLVIHDDCCSRSQAEGNQAESSNKTLAYLPANRGYPGLNSAVCSANPAVSVHALAGLHSTQYCCLVCRHILVASTPSFA